MSCVSIPKQYFRLTKNVDQFTDGQVEMLSWDSDDEVMKIRISPNGGLYAGGKYEFSLYLPYDFPESAPTASCETAILHPNIDPFTESEDGVCISLFDDWTASNDLEDCIMGLLFLFYNPNVDDPLTIRYKWAEMKNTFEDEVKKLLRGGEFDGHTFPKFIDDDDMLDEQQAAETISPEGEDALNVSGGFVFKANSLNNEVKNVQNIPLPMECDLESRKGWTVSMNRCYATSSPKLVLKKSLSECLNARSNGVLTSNSKTFTLLYKSVSFR